MITDRDNKYKYHSSFPGSPWKDFSFPGSAWEGPRISRFQALPSLVFLLLLALLAGCKGSQESKTAPEKDAYRQQQAGDKWREDLLNYAIDSLNQIEKYQTQETYLEIFRQINSWQQLPGMKKEPSLPDSLSGALPQPEMLRQITDRLNQWLRTRQLPADWKPDPLVETLPGALKELPLVKDLGNMEFSGFEGYMLLQAVYLRDLAHWVRGEALDDLTRAKNLFDWTIRNVQLEADKKDRTPLFPWETLYFGRGTAMERAWVFILLARQEGLDAVVLALADPAENTPIARGIRPLQPWCLAVLIDNQAYLFDPLLGLPIAAKDGIRHDAQGRLDIQPATLAQVIADGSLLRRLDLDESNVYPVKSEDLENLAALVEAAPSELSYRTKLIESRLAGKTKMAISASASAQAERWQAVSGIRQARLWLLPYETIKRRSQLAPGEIRGHLAEFLQFYALPGAPLCKGRLLHLKGELSGQQGATQLYQSSRPFYRELEFLAALPAGKDLDKLHQDLAKIKNDLTKAGNDPTAQPPPSLQQRKEELNEKIADVDLAKMLKKLETEYIDTILKLVNFQSEEEKKNVIAGLQQEALQMLVSSILLGKQDATYWLGLVAYERGNYNSAADYFLKRTLEMHPQGPWRHGARYNLARTVEAQGEIERAVMMYQSDPDAPDVHGRLLRARWLEEKKGQ